MTEANSNPLQTIIGEFKNISPEITSTFIFNKNGEVLASSGAVHEALDKKLIVAFNEMVDRASFIDGMETLTIQGANSQLSIISMNNRYLVNVSSRSADEKTVKILTSVLVPTVVKLIDQISQSAGSELTQAENLTFESIKDSAHKRAQKTQNKSSLDMSACFMSEPFLPEPPVQQFMIEKIGGFMVPCDIVRIDGDVIAKWHDIYGDKKITRVHVETLEGKEILCGFKPIKESSNTGKGIIQFPEKMMQTLQTSKGKLVIVKPEISS